MKKTKNFFFKHPVIYSLIIVIILGIIGFTTFSKNTGEVATIIVNKGQFKRQVSVSGKVVAAQSADLGFEQGGRLGSIQSPVGTFVKKGSIIASLENGDIRAELLQKEAALEREQAKLNSLIQGTRPEQLTIDKQAYRDATSALITAIRSTILDTELALLSDIDSNFFENGSSVNPNFLITLSSYAEEKSIENKRAAISEKIAFLKNNLTKITEPYTNSSIQSINDEGLTVITSINNFIDDLSRIIDNKNLSQTEKDSYQTTINSAAQTIATTLKTFQTANANWSSKRDSLSLSEAGTNSLDINAQMANVKASRADVESAQAKLRKTLIIAPFDGTVTRMNIKVGEIISSNSAEISLMSTNSFNIESYVPEIHIANIQLGNKASVTLDAYENESPFEARVTIIDPAETIKDGVSTYKVTLAFTQNDPRIKSGMTGSISIVTLEKENSIVVPQSSISKRDGKAFVYKINQGVLTETEVELGSSTSLGQVEIVNGLSQGDEIAVTAPTK